MNHSPSTAVAGAEALAVREAALELFESGGRHILSPAAKKLVRDGAQESARRALTNTAAPHVVRDAGRAVVGSAGKAACLGGLLDGGVAAIESGIAHQRGDITADEGVESVIREGSSGAAAAAVGALAAAGLVVLTGPVSTPVLMVVAAGSSAATKATLCGWWR